MDGKATDIDNIERTVLDKLLKVQQNFLWNGNNKRLNTWHVSDLISECLRKTHYTKTQPMKFDPSKAGIFFMGHIVHDATPLSTINELLMCYNMETEMSMTPEEVDQRPLDERGSIVTGTLDDLLKVGTDFIIADKKTYNGGGWFKKTEPDYSYAYQINIYRVLLEASYGIDAKYGCLLYLDKKDNLAPTPIAFELDPIEDTKQRMRDTMEQLKSGDPERKIGWLCNRKNKKKVAYCDYVDICDSECGPRTKEEGGA